MDDRDEVREDEAAAAEAMAVLRAIVNDPAAPSGAKVQAARSILLRVQERETRRAAAAASAALDDLIR